MITQKQLTKNQIISQKEKLADASALLCSAIDDLNNDDEGINILDIAQDIETAIEVAKQVSGLLRSRKEWMVEIASLNRRLNALEARANGGE